MRACTEAMPADEIDSYSRTTGGLFEKRGSGSL